MHPTPRPFAPTSSPQRALLHAAMLAAVGLAAPWPAPAQTQVAAADPAAAPDTTAATAAAGLANVTITGLRGSQRSIDDSPAPIDVIQSEQLLRTGRAELSEALAKLLPSINLPINVAGLNSVVRPVTNRGLGAAYTLVLVNGKRRHNAAVPTNGGADNSGVTPVDLDQIPLTAIDHIEVLKDSAAAQYGSDAVAGVVNIVLKTQAHGGGAALELGHQSGGGPGSDGANRKLAADIGLPLGADGSLHLSADARRRGQYWSNAPATNRVIYAPASNPKNAQWNGDGAHNGDPGVEAYNLAANAELPLGDALTLYGHATAGTRHSDAGNNFRRPNGLGTIAQIFPDGYFAQSNAASQDAQVLAGARGNWSAWTWDLSTTYGRNRVHQSSNLTLNPSLGPASPTHFDDLATYRNDQWTTNLDVTRGIDAGLAKPLQWAWGLEHRHERFRTFAGDPLGYINGGYVFQPGDQEGDPNVGKPASVGAQAAVALAPADTADVRRNVLAAYSDLGLTVTDQLFADAAVRFEHYDDSAGNTLSGKLNGRWDATPAFALRATVGSGFRAPSLSQIGYAQTDNRTNVNAAGQVVPSLSKQLRNDSALARALGAEPLTPERSFNVGIGTVLQPAERVHLTIDAYQINIKDRIVRTGYLYGPAFTALLQANGLTGTEWVQYFANGADTRTRGLDVVADGSARSGAFGLPGDWRWSAALNLNRTMVRKVRDTPAQITALVPTPAANPGGNAVWFGRPAQGDLSVGQPSNKLVLGAGWKVAGFDASLQTTRYGGVTWQRTQDPAQDVRFGARWITDLDLGHAVTRAVTLTVGAANLFNVKPQRNGPGDPNTGQGFFSYYTPPYSPYGAYYYARVGYAF